MRKITNMIVICALLLFCFSMTVSAHEHEGHDYTTSSKSYYNSTYHQIYHYCNTCHQSFYELEKHRTGVKWTKQKEENFNPYVKKMNYIWQWGYPCCQKEIFSAYLDSAIGYKNSSQLEVSLVGYICKGDVIKVKVGDNTYQKKIKKDSEDPYIDFKIKKPKKNYKIKIWITHARKKIYLGCDYIKTSEKPQIGMTKSQVKKYTLWFYDTDDGECSYAGPEGFRIGHDSEGCIYWRRFDLSYIVFKNGKVINYQYYYGDDGKYYFYG